MKMNLDLAGYKTESTGHDDLLPPGEYQVKFTGAELIPTKSGTALKLIMSVINGECVGKQVSDFLNIKNNSDVAEKISLGRLKRICEITTGKTFLSDTDELMGKMVAIRTEQEQRGEYTHNKIKAYGDMTDVKSVATSDHKPQEVAKKKNPWE